MGKNKQDLIDVMSEQADISKVIAETALNAMTDYITEVLIEGGDVSIVGWGKWVISNRAARIGRNPQTGAEMQIPASRVPKFKAGKKLKEAVNVDS
jgi:DNA-binding protein HU-beta